MAYNSGCGGSGQPCSSYDDPMGESSDEYSDYSGLDDSNAPGINDTSADRNYFQGSSTVENTPNFDPIDYYTNEPPGIGGTCKRTCSKGKKRLQIPSHQLDDFYSDLSPLRPGPSGPPDPGTYGLDMGAGYSRPNMARDARQRIPAGTVQRTARRHERTRGIPPHRTQTSPCANDEEGEWCGGQFQQHENPTLAAARADLQRRGGLEAFMKYGSFRPKCGQQ